MNKNKFVHLHVHTEYSLLDGLSNLKKLVNYTKELGMNSLAITDHGALYGAIDFYKECQKNEVKPIIGVEGYITNVKISERPERAKIQNFHLILLAKDKEGYKNLMKLTSEAHLKGYYYRPRFDRDTLIKYSKGLICTSACSQGEVAQALIEDNFDKAKTITQWYLDIFGKDYYLEIQKHEYKEYLDSVSISSLKNDLIDAQENEDKVVKGKIKLSRLLGIPILATNDVHYVKKEESEAQDALVCIATGKNVSDIKRLRYPSPTFYLRSPEEMQKLFKEIPEAIENSVKISEKCNLNIELGKWYFPKFALSDDITPEQELKNIVKTKIKDKFKDITKEIKDRISYELDIIIKKGYAPYFLIVSDMVNWANSEGIVTNTRGSAAGSLVSYVLGITTVNPLKYNLPFERFLNPFRPSPPDIDFDISDNRREDVIKYMSDKYGKEKVAQICTFGRMKARASVRDIARVLGYPYSTGDRIAKLIPLGSQGFPMTIEKALAISSDFKSLYDQDKDAKKVIELARIVEGNARHISVHAAGLVISPKEITEFTAVQLEPSGDKVITQYEMHACEDVGLIKFDILGIRNLSILSSAIEIVKESRNITVNLGKIPLDDKKTYEMLARGETMGTFQLSSAGMTRYLKELKPTRIEDLMAMVALYRPGPMQVIPEYIERKKNPSLIKYLDPRMKKFLEMSYGLIVYQDDLLFCALELAGYTWEEADKFRKAVGKKIPEEMAAQKKKFIDGIIKNGQTLEFAENLWKLFEPFQSYGFNKAHAASYGMVAYQTAYMKANFPVEFMNALLTAESGDPEKISLAVNECRRMKINVLPPDINDSNIGFKIIEDKDSLEEKGIRFGLSAIKNVGKAAIEAIINAREESPFVSFYDFLARVDARKVNKRVVESLVKVGALSRFGARAKLLYYSEEIRGKVSRPQVLKGQQDLFNQDEKISKKDITKELFSKTDIAEFSEEEIQTLERQLLGFSLSAKPIIEIISDFEHESSHKIFELSSDQNIGEIVRIAAVITDIRIVITRKSGQEMAFVKVDDGTGTIDLVVFPRLFKSVRNMIVDYKPIIISGKIDSRDDGLSLLAESIYTPGEEGPEGNEVFIKVSEKVTSSQLRDLKNLLLNNQGSKDITLIFTETGKNIKLPYKISWNESIAKQISSILEGDGSSGVE